MPNGIAWGPPFLRLLPGRMTGARLPPGHLTLPGGSVTRLYELFHDGRFVLLSPDGVPDGLPGCVKTGRYARCSARLPRTVLVRPDGYIAWV